MALTGIHCCAKLSAENLELKKKCHKLKHQKEEIQRQLNEIEKNRSSQRGSASNTKSVSVQTQTPVWLKPSICRQQPSRSKTLSKASAKTETQKDKKESEEIMAMLSMQNQLMKRYEREVKQNMEHLETITNLNGKIAQLESKLLKDEEEIFKMKRELFKLKGNTTGSGPSLKDITKERNKLKKENEKLRAELQAFDQGFFDEVEDIKYALQQSAKLNQEYDKVLHKMCKNYGVPFPKIEKVLDS